MSSPDYQEKLKQLEGKEHNLLEREKHLEEKYKHLRVQADKEKEAKDKEFMMIKQEYEKKHLDLKSREEILKL